MTQPVYLRSNVIAEPLFNFWYAWSYLISPATVPMYLTNLHLPIMRSFVAAPEVHAATFRDPKMVGAPFINYDASKVGEIRALLDRTTREQAHMIKFAEAVKELDALLATKPRGMSLEPCYAEVPPVLRGYVELIYDMNNNVSFRFLEGLLYKSRYYDTSLQSLSLSVINDDYRPFVFSTPRLESNDTTIVKVPFASERVDELFRMKRAPKPRGYLADVLGIRDESRIDSFVTEEPPRPAARYAGEGVRIRYYSHACILIETRNISILTDPVMSYRYPTSIERYTYDDLPEVIDYVLISHNHQDHCVYETLLPLRHKVRNIVVPASGGGVADPSLKLLFKHIGMKSVIELSEMEEVSVGGGVLTSVPFLGEHADLDIRTKTGYFLKLEGRSIYIGADSCNIDPEMFRRLHECVGDVDVLFIGMECDGAPLTWLYGPLLTKPIPRKMEQTRRFNGCNYPQAVTVVDTLRPKQAYVYAMGLEPWLVYLTSLAYPADALPMTESNKLVDYCRGKGIVSERLLYQKELLI
jgi:L-ascorbate metabolism protein UlaG (beta-lactamase superfamily)